MKYGEFRSGRSQQLINLSGERINLVANRTRIDDCMETIHFSWELQPEFNNMQGAHLVKYWGCWVGAC